MMLQSPPGGGLSPYLFLPTCIVVLFFPAVYTWRFSRGPCCFSRGLCCDHSCRNSWRVSVFLIHCPYCLVTLIVTILNLALIYHHFPLLYSIIKLCHLTCCFFMCCCGNRTLGTGGGVGGRVRQLRSANKARGNIHCTDH